MEQDRWSTWYSNKGWSNLTNAIWLEMCFQATCKVSPDNFNMYDRKMFFRYLMKNSPFTRPEKEGPMVIRINSKGYVKLNTYKVYDGWCHLSYSPFYKDICFSKVITGVNNEYYLIRDFRHCRKKSWENSVELEMLMLEAPYSPLQIKQWTR